MKGQTYRLWQSLALRRFRLASSRICADLAYCQICADLACCQICADLAYSQICADVACCQIDADTVCCQNPSLCMIHPFTLEDDWNNKSPHLQGDTLMFTMHR